MGQDTESRGQRGFGDTNILMVTGRDEPAATPLAEADFTLDVEGVTQCGWGVQRFDVTEALSSLYECVIDLASEGFADNPDDLLGRRAVLRVQRDALTRRFCGLVRRVEHRGATGTHRLARVRLVPALWTLSQRSNSRVFQDVTAVDVVRAVLTDAGLYERTLDARLLRRYPTREYCVQFRETDLAFVTRLLEAEGVTFFFRHGDDGETLVLADGAHAWDAVPTLDGADIPLAGAEGATHRVETVRNLTWDRELRPTSVMVRDYDFTRPGFELARMANRPTEGAPRALYEPSAALTLERYHDGAYDDDDAQEQAQMRLDAERVLSASGRGEGRVTGMCPGARFTLGLAGTHLAKSGYLVTLVEHMGEAGEELVLSTEREALEADRYRNRFECVQAEAPYRPERRAPRPVIAGLQTATVTAPEGEEVYTDQHGRVRVRFHWDRFGPKRERSSCWLRAMQGPWSGSGWGFQFVPRAGMEVAVSFLDGDPDRPVIVGALYNGTHPPPFALPQERTRGGLRTQSIGGDGYNELSFEDLAGAEQVYLRAQRDLRELVRNDRAVEVGGDARETIRGARVTDVTRDDARTVRGNADEHVFGARRARVEADDRVTVMGSAERTVFADERVRVEGRARREVAGDVEEVLRDDSVTRVHGHQATLVGRHEAKRSAVLHVEGTASSWSSLATEITSEKDIVLRCGTSMIRLTPKRVEIISPEVIVRGGERGVTVLGDAVRVRAKRQAVIGAEKVTVKSQGAALALDAEAKVMGAKVNLGTGSIALDGDPDEPARPTTIELTDEEGAPMAGQRFVIVMGDGSEQTGFLDREGKAVIELDGGARVLFPELDGVEEA
ncbi:MAG: type VI secretion system tip protein TssI/VgrG [Polyangiales bacterium]